MNYKNFTDLSNDIRKNIYKVQNVKYDLVVGLPRSGMIPAYMISLLLNIECTDINSLIEDKALKKGSTRGSRKNLNFPSEAENILLVDDSILSGKSLERDLSSLSSELRRKITTLAIYSSTSSRDDVDIFFEYLPMPRVFEWNIFHHGILSKSCVDIDGVLCVDPTEDENDDGVKYIDFLQNATPLFIPTGKIHSLVTSRLEKYRVETEAWLKKYGISYDNLIMLDLPTMEERRRLGVHAKHKANYYKNSSTMLFIESNVSQASEILNRTSKEVYCVDNNCFYKADIANILKNNPQGFKKYLPESIKQILRPIYQKYIRNQKAR